MQKIDGEPEFALLARDKSAPEMVRQWAYERERQVAGGLAPASDTDQIARARMVATDMEMWRIANDGKWRLPQVAQPMDITRIAMLAAIEEQQAAVRTGRLGDITVKIHGIQTCLVIEDVDTGRSFVITKDAGVFPVAPNAEWISVDEIKKARH